MSQHGGAGRRGQFRRRDVSGIYNRASDANTLADPSLPYHPSTNLHRGDVPGKMKLIAEHICGAYLDGPVAEPASAIARHRSYIRRFDDHIIWPTYPQEWDCTISLHKQPRMP